MAPPPFTANFDHLQEFGSLSFGESNIDKINQIQVFTGLGCISSGGGCISSIFQVVALTTTYLLKNSTLSRKSNDSLGTLAANTLLNSGDYISRIELYTETYITHIKFCTSSGPYHGPYGSSLAIAPITVFEQPGSVIKASHGFSGTWFDGMGVYYS
jgi:hypothetical protein